jgi:hypothetical protein
MAAGRALAAVWCRSVGSAWTLELHQLDGGPAPGRVVDWINSGVPITQPAPDAMARGLLAQRGLHLFADPVPGPHILNRRCIGYVCPLTWVARLTAHDATEAHHPAPVDSGLRGHCAGHADAGGVADD